MTEAEALALPMGARVVRRGLADPSVTVSRGTVTGQLEIAREFVFAGITWDHFAPFGVRCVRIHYDRRHER